MATKEAGDLKEQVAGITECPICAEELVNNRLLPCGHTFCLKCLEQYRKQTNPKGKCLLCPICRKEFVIPKGGCSALTKNYALEQLTGAKKSATDIDLVQCDVCDNDKKRTAIMFCFQCEQNMCSDCERTHKKMKSTSTHHAVPASKKEQLKHFVDKNICEEHTDQHLELVCSDCNEAICWKCRSLGHQSHSCVEIGKMADQCVEQLKLNFEDTEKRIFMLTKISANISDKRKQQQENFDKEKSNIARLSADMIRTIVANEEKLVKQLEAASTRNIKRLQPQEERVDKQLEALKHHKISLRQTLDCGQPWEIFRRANDLHDKTEELLILDIVDAEEPSSSNLSDIQIKEHLIGNKPIVPIPPAVLANKTQLVAENKVKQPPQTPREKQTTPSSVTSFESGSSIIADSTLKPFNAKVAVLASKTQLVAENKVKQQPKTSLEKQTTPSLVAAPDSGSSLKEDSTVKPFNVKVEKKTERQPPPVFAKPTTKTTDAEICRGGSSFTTEPSEILCDMKDVDLLTYDEDGYTYINFRQAQLDTSCSTTAVGILNFDERGYANIGQGQMVGPESTPPMKKVVDSIQQGTQKQQTILDWYNKMTVEKITDDCKAITGVTILKEKVYFILEESSVIKAYDANTLKCLPEFRIKDLQQPKYLTSCIENNCLYIAGLKEQTVFKVETKRGTVLLKVKTGEDAYNISTTRNGNVILIGLLTKTLKEYTSEGHLLRTIILKPDSSMAISRPWHAMKLDSGNYVICQGHGNVGKHRVCVINPHGEILQSFGDDKGSGTNGLYGPYHLALDEKGNILVADCNNHRIVVLSSSLQYVTEIKTDLRLPTRLAIDSETGALYVADNEMKDGKRTNGQIVIFKAIN